MKYIIVCLLFVLSVLFICCNDSSNPTDSGSVTPSINPTIWHTDSLGNSLGGDTTDWCFRGNSCLRINPAYPNPTVDTVSISFACYKDTLSLYTLNSNIDTIFIIKNQALSAGFYIIKFSGHSLGLHNIVKRFYLKSKNNCFNNSDCKNYGDIQFF